MNRIFESAEHQQNNTHT